MRRTNADIVRSQLAEQQLIVKNLLRWTDLEFATFQQEVGIDYLKNEFAIADELVHELTKYKAFWSWWRLQWMRRDKEFVEMSSILFPNEYDGYYRKLHDPSSVLFKPLRTIIRQTYLQLVDQIVKGLAAKKEVES